MYPEQTQKVFEALTRGNHLCAEDGAPFHDVQANLAEYTQLFKALGFTLENSPRGYVYCTGSGADSGARSMEEGALLVYLLLDAKMDQGHSVKDVIAPEIWYPLSEMNFLNDPRYQALVCEMGLDKEERVVNACKYLVRMGFATWQTDPQAISFRPPVARIIEAAEHARLIESQQGDIDDLDA